MAYEFGAVSVVFFTLGLTCHGVDFILLAAVPDILVGTDIPTSTLLAAMSVPSSIMFFIGPYFITSISYKWRIFIVTSCLVVAYPLIAFMEGTTWKLFGVALESFSYALGEATFLGLSSLFSSERALFAYSIGCGCGLLGSAVYYMALTTWLCVSPSITLIILLPLCLLYPVCYYVITKLSNQNPSHSMNYDLLISSKEDCVKENEMRLTNKQKFSAIWKVLAYVAIPEFISSVSKYTSLESIVTTIVYPIGPYPARNYYQYYFLSYHVGEALGRAFRLMLHAISPRLVYHITLPELWFLATLQVFHMILYITESWYRYLPGLWSLIALCFTGGLFTGIFLYNALEFLSKSLKEKEREFGMGYALCIVDVGALVASFLGLYVEKQLKKHCTSMTGDSSLCLSRAKSYQEVILQCQQTFY